VNAAPGNRSGVWAVILAAGLSSRMRGFKPLLPLGFGTLLQHVTSLFTDLGVGVLVVTGHRAEEVEAAADEAGARPVRNPDYAQGMFTSVLAGMRALPQDAEAVFMLPVDIPLVRPLTLELLLRARLEHPGRILHPVFQGRRGHPPLLPASLVPDILSWPGHGGLAGLLETRNDAGVEVPVPDANILFDVDSDEDYAEALRRAQRLDIPTRDECEILLAQVPALHPMTVIHSRAVAHFALEMARSVGGLDPALVEAGALLHDIAKGHRDHERRGGDMLRDMGFVRVADIVALHRDIQPPDGPITETEIVYLADKVARGAQLVPVEERFQAKLDQYAHDPEAVAAIQGRRTRALAVRQCVERAAGAPLSQLLTPYPG